jgi:hypothetical protein
MTNIFKQIYIRSAGHSYTNMGRLFLRMFTGVMMMQFGIRQWYGFSGLSGNFPAYFGMSSEMSLAVMIAVEVLCSFCIMVGFCTRMMAVPPFIAMVVAEHYLLSNSPVSAPYMLSWGDPGYVPMLFLGIYFFIFLVGPGKISVDYFLSLHFIHTDDKSESELEEV